MYNKLKVLMEKEHKTAYRIAKDTGIAQTSLSAWKLGISKPGVKNLKILADYFDVSVDYFLNTEKK